MVEILRIVFKIQSKLEKKETENGRKMSEFLKKNIGNSFTQDVDSDGDIDKDDEMVNCAATVNEIAKRVLGDTLGLSYLGNINTAKLLEDIEVQKWRFFEVSKISLKKGDIIISPTDKKIGHVGYYFGGGLIASNNSYTGKLDTHHTLESWKERYVKKFGLKMKFYRII